MKAKVIETGKIVNVVPMDGNWCDPSETRYYSDKELDFSLVTDGWDAYRREATKAAMQGILSGGEDWQGTLTECREGGRCEYPSEIANFAVACADALIKRLKGE